MQTTDSSPSKPSRGLVSRDFVGGLALLGVAALFLLNAGEVVDGRYDWLFPIVLSYALGGLSLAMLLRGLLGRRDRMSLLPRVLRGEGVDVVLFSGLIIVYVILIEPLGFWITSLMTLFVGAVFLDTRRTRGGILLALGVACLASVIAYLALTQLFYINFPPTPWLDVGF